MGQLDPKFALHLIMEFLHFILEEEGSVFVGAQIINKSKEFVPFETMLAFIAFDEDVACVQI